MPDREMQITLPGGQTVTAVLTSPETPTNDWLFVYAPGAGSSLRDGFGIYASEMLMTDGIATLRFQFPYQENRKRRPDRPQLLEETWRAVIDHARDLGARMAVGGRSMGGRIASQVVAQGTRVEALALFAYPLHPPGNPLKARDAHLGDIGAPTLFCSGTRDAFGTPEELRAAAAKVRQQKLHLLEGADHGFKTLKSGGRSREDVWEEALGEMVAWLGSI